MRAKKYLYQIREEKKEIDELRERIMSVEASMYPSGIRYDLEKVQKIQSNGAAERLTALIDYRVLETEKDIDDWNHGRVRVLLAHPASVGYGLNLQAGGHIIAWYGLTWSLEQYLQANARLHRQGQTKPVLVYRILAKDTVDAQIAESLTRKDAAQEAVLNILKRRREKEYERRGGMGRSDKSASHSDSGAG